MLLLFSTLQYTSCPLQVQIAKGKERFSKYCIVAFVGKFSAIVYCIRVCTNVGNLFIFWADTDPIRVSPFLMTLVSFPNLAVLIQIPVIPSWRLWFPSRYSQFGGFVSTVYSIFEYFQLYWFWWLWFRFRVFSIWRFWFYSISGYPDFDDFGSILGYSQFGVQNNKF